MTLTKTKLKNLIINGELIRDGLSFQCRFYSATGNVLSAIIESQEDRKEFFYLITNHLKYMDKTSNLRNIVIAKKEYLITEAALLKLYTQMAGYKHFLAVDIPLYHIESEEEIVSLYGNEFGIAIKRDDIQYGEDGTANVTESSYELVGLYNVMYAFSNLLRNFDDYKLDDSMYIQANDSNSTDDGVVMVGLKSSKVNIIYSDATEKTDLLNCSVEDLRSIQKYLEHIESEIRYEEENGPKLKMVPGTENHYKGFVDSLLRGFINILEVDDTCISDTESKKEFFDYLQSQSKQTNNRLKIRLVN